MAKLRNVAIEPIRGLNEDIGWRATGHLMIGDRAIAFEVNGMPETNPEFYDQCRLFVDTVASLAIRDLRASLDAESS